MTKKRDWFRIENAADEDEAEVYIYGPIGGSLWDDTAVEPQSFAKELAAIEAKTLRIRINSLGGNVFAGAAIAEAIRRHPAHTVAHVDGIAASAASRIAIAADETRMSRDGFFMIHNARAVAIGEAKDMRKTADVLDKMNTTIIANYVEKTGASEKAVREWMDEETWFTAQEALDEGFIDAVEDTPAVEAEIDPRFFNSVPAELLERAEKPKQAKQQIETVRDFESFLRDAGGFSRVRAKQIAASGYTAASGPRDEGGAVYVAAIQQLTANIES